MNDQARRVALLIDAENADPARRADIERRAQNYGTIVRRIGFGRSPSRKWKDGEPALEWPAQEGQKAGRNAGDIDLAFTAGELLHTDDIDCFCIASGDSDFAGLARRLRDAGKTVIGIGEPTKTAKAFREACDRFEKLRKGKAKGAESPTQPKPKKAKGTSTQPDKTAKVGAGKRKEFLKLVRAATAEERGQWLLATWLGDRLRTLKPGFRNEDFGAKRLSTLLKAYPAQIELRPGPKGAEFRMRGQSAEKASTTHNDGPTKAEAKVDVDRDERLSGGKAQQDGAMALAGTACGTDDGASRWLGKLPEDLASLGPEAWDAIVREAEDEATRTKEWASGAARMIDEHFEKLCAERENSMLQMAMGLIDPEDVTEPWNALVTFGTWPRPMRLECIEHESQDMVDRLLPLNPIVGAIRHQHDADPDLRRKARRIIVDHFRGSGLEQHYGERWTN